MISGRKSVNIYDYPEHLNPFYEDDVHNRIRFWDRGKKLIRSGSFSLSEFKSLPRRWSFRSKTKTENGYSPKPSRPSLQVNISSSSHSTNSHNTSRLEQQEIPQRPSSSLGLCKTDISAPSTPVPPPRSCRSSTLPRKKRKAPPPPVSPSGTPASTPAGTPIKETDTNGTPFDETDVEIRKKSTNEDKVEINHISSVENDKSVDLVVIPDKEKDEEMSERTVEKENKKTPEEQKLSEENCNTVQVTETTENTQIKVETPKEDIDRKSNEFSEEITKPDIIISECDENTKDQQISVNLEEIVDVACIDNNSSSLVYHYDVNISLQATENDELLYKNEVVLYVQETKDDTNNNDIPVKTNEENKEILKAETSIDVKVDLKEEKSEKSIETLEDDIGLTNNENITCDNETNNNIVEEQPNLEDPDQLLKQIQKLQQEVESMTFGDFAPISTPEYYKENGNDMDNIPEMREFQKTVGNFETKKRRSWQTKENKVML